jgi:hypothetical protein
VRKTLYLLNINNYAPKITALTYPLLERYAKYIGAHIEYIDTRKFPAWDIDYEKLQIYERSKKNGSDWSIYLDSDALVHPDMPDVTELLRKDTCAHNGSDHAAIRWTYDNYFRRDGRNIGSCCWCMVCSDWCLDMVRPLDDLTPKQAYANIRTTISEQQSGVVTPEHLVTDYAVSRNIARYGLKFTTLNSLIGTSGNFFHHVYTETVDKKVEILTNALKDWKL